MITPNMSLLEILKAMLAQSRLSPNVGLGRAGQRLCKKRSPKSMFLAQKAEEVADLKEFSDGASSRMADSMTPFGGPTPSATKR
jgi:hypothetical protein